MDNALNKTEIERQKPIWTALSEFYLDTELGAEEIKRIAEVFRTSQYSLEELKEINYAELAPILYINLLSVAGAWNGFDEEWLHTQILKRLNKNKGKGLFSKMLSTFCRKLIDKACNDYWQAVEIEMKNAML